MPGEGEAARRHADDAPPLSFGHFPRTAGATLPLWIPAFAGMTWVWTPE